MSNKVIIDTTTGTVLDVADCYVVDADLVNDDVMFDDNALAEIAEKYGTPVIGKRKPSVPVGDGEITYAIEVHLLETLEVKADNLSQAFVKAKNEVMSWEGNPQNFDMNLVSSTEDIELIEVEAHWDDEVAEFAVERVFGRLPEGFNGDTEEYPEDDQVSYWLEHDEKLVVGGQYGDFIVTKIEGGAK